MTAKELASELMKHPDEIVWTTNKKSGRRMLYSTAGVEKNPMGLIIYPEL